MKCSGHEFTDLSKDILLKGGSVRFRAKGASMYPLIRDGEVILIEPADISRVRYADMLFCHDRDGKPVVHRVIKRCKKDGKISIVTKGDHSSSSDGCIFPEEIIGRVSAIEKADNVIRVDKGVWRLANVFYAVLLPFSKWAYLLVSKPLLRGRIKDRSRTCPEGAIARSEKEYYKNSFRNVLIYEEAKKVLSSFGERGINTIILKGIFLAENIYKNAALRPMTDIDILIRKADLPRANEVLVSLGYPAPGHYNDLLDSDRPSPVNSIMYFPGDGRKPSIHLHWHIINSTWPLESLVRKIDMEKIWKSAEGAAIDGVETLTLGPEHLIIYLAYHSFHHSFSKPVMAQDIAETIRFYKERIDWDRVKKEADGFGLSFTVYLSLRYAAKVLRFECPGKERLRPAKLNLIEKIVLSLLNRNRCTYGLSYLVYLSEERGMLGRVRFLFRTLFPSRLLLSSNLRVASSELRLPHYFRRILGGFSSVVFSR